MIPNLVRRRRRRSFRLPFEGAGLGCGAFVSLLLLGVVFSAILGYMRLVQDLPSLERLALDLDPTTGRIYQPTRLLDRAGEQEIFVLENPAAVGRQILALDPSQPNHLPSTLVKATLAGREPDFWQNPGYILSDLAADTHPTLAQRLVYELLLVKEPAGLRRNLRERLLAAQIIQRFGHEQSLTWYLNTVQYGEYIYGADAAGRVFFGKQASLLDIAEAAYLAALSESPQANPWNDPPGVRDRQREIIQTMLGLGWISADEAIQASRQGLTLQPQQPVRDLSPSFSKGVLDQLARQFPGENLARGGWKITTTLDYALQLNAQCATVAQLARIGGQPSPAQSDSSPGCAASQLLPTIAPDRLGAMDNLETAVIILDPKTGQVLAMVGDASASRPAGAILTPIVYLSAFTRGWGPASLVWDIPDPAREFLPELELPESKVYRGPMRLRTALINDAVQPVVTLARQLGWDVIQVTASQLGITALQSPAASGLNAQLFEAGASLLEVSQAYGVFANQGVLSGQATLRQSPNTAGVRLQAPISVIRLQDADEVIWLDWSEPENQPLISPQLAYVVNHVLSDEPARWSRLGHPNPLEIGRPAGAKASLTLDGQAGWVVGYTPQVVVGVWAGKSELIPGEIALAIPAGIWHALMQHATQNQPIAAWEIPAGVQLIDVCDPSGLIPTAYCPTVVTEVFLPGAEPTQLDHLYRAFQINRETGRLATVFTPPELVEEKVFLVPPPEAKEWAEEAGFPNPPDVYDVISAAPAAAHAAISIPAMFAHISGVVQFKGTAGGPAFNFYRLQVGQGLNPQTWIQLGEDLSQPVADGLLGTWDARALSGLYAIQLLVVSQDQRVERAVIQVTVDNQPPEVQIISPKTDQEFSLDSQLALVLQAEVHDNLEIDQVSFFIDKSLVAVLYDPPYLVSWKPTPGEHTLVVRAVDLAGNESETAALFQVK
jgi:membrane peptidoglycan carboxypeptidase